MNRNYTKIRILKDGVENRLLKDMQASSDLGLDHSMRQRDMVVTILKAIVKPCSIVQSWRVILQNRTELECNPAE